MAYPRYLDAFESGRLEEKAETAVRYLEHCVLCPKKCGTNRLKDETGFCRTPRRAFIVSAFAHHGEEPPLSGTRGSGTIFFSRCNMRCLYCQNYQFSQLDEGRPVTADGLAETMLELQEAGCHNINFVTPTHVMPQILEALIPAIKKGLRLPLVYNTSGYELPEVLKLLDGIIDIYLPDMRYADSTLAAKYSAAPHYAEFNRESVREMHRQVDEAVFDAEGLITQGLIIRHLVLPEDIAGTEETLAFIAREISTETPVSLMSQYFPCFEAPRTPPLDRRISCEEYEHACALLHKFGLENSWIQESGGLKRFAGIHIKKNI